MATDDFTIEEWAAKIDEEGEKWVKLGISLDSMNYAGSEIFEMKCKLQALINCILQEDTSEENLMLNLKEIIFTSMEGIRIGIEPQIQQAKINAIKGGVIPPQMFMPKGRKNDQH